MTTAIATTGIPDVDARERQWIAEQEREHQQVAWLELGYRTLGYQQMPRKENGVLVDYVWVQARPEQTAGIPPAIVEQARQAIARELAAREQLEARSQQANAEIARRGLTGEAASSHWQTTRGEAWGAYQETRKPTRLAVRDVGKLAEEIATHRATVNRIPAELRALDEQYAAAKTRLETERLAAQAALVRLGIE